MSNQDIGWVKTSFYLGVFTEIGEYDEKRGPELITDNDQPKQHVARIIGEALPGINARPSQRSSEPA
jgi:hypothetical protein